MENGSRRPLASRDAAWAKRLASHLVERGVQPNHVSLASIVFAGVGGIAFAERAHFGPGWFDSTLLLVGIIGMQGRLVCNLLDGMIAVEGKRGSPIGELYNEIPDRISDVAILVGVGFGTAPYFPYAFWLGWIAAAGALMTAYVRALGAACGTSHYFCGPMAKPHRMACLTAASALQIVANTLGWSINCLGWALIAVVFGTAITCIRRTKLIAAALWLQSTKRPGPVNAVSNVAPSGPV